MKISTAKTELLYLSRNLVEKCLLQVNGVKLQQVEYFKYLGVAFMSDGRQDEKLDNRILVSLVKLMQALHYSVVMKQKLRKRAKL